jgi:DNA mismatch endonuclease (patch repair protein)
MAAVKRKDTRPELALRAALRAARVTGYRVDYKRAPGRPDLAFTRWRVAVFVDGAWWHGRPDRWHPDRSTEFWQLKIGRNMERDREVDAALEAGGWLVLRLWDDEVVKDPAHCVERVLDALAANGRDLSPTRLP